MVYKVIGLMSGSSLDGLDIAYVHLQERASSNKQVSKSWEFELIHTACYPYPDNWKQRLAAAPTLSALDYQLLHVEYGAHLGELVSQFISTFELDYKVQLIVSHGHTAFHWPARQLTAQLGDGAAIAARTRINVVSDLRAMDLALGGQGAPIVPIGEELLLPGYELFLNLGGIANVSKHGSPASAGGQTGSGGGSAGFGVGLAGGDYAVGFLAFDVCPANRVLNSLAALERMPFDANGALAATGEIDHQLLQQLNALPYYNMPYPKSLANEFGTQVVFPLVRQAMDDRGLSTADALRTYVEHIALQVARAVEALGDAAGEGKQAAGKGKQAAGERKQAAGDDAGGAGAGASARRMLVTGGGAHNAFLVERLRHHLGFEVVVPDKALVDFKEALVMALIGVLRWREENNVRASVTGASRDSIGGAVWIGQEG